MKNIRYHEAAEAELLHEIGYLELRTKGLGRRFLAEIRKAERSIAEFPQSAAEIRPGIRRRVLHKFHYSHLRRGARRAGDSGGSSQQSAAGLLD